MPSLNFPQASWRKPAVALAVMTITATTAFTTAGAARAATAAPAAPKAQATQAAPAAATLTWPLVAQGATGERVAAIQYLLNQRIAAGLAVDGKFGPKTEAAIRDFQKRSGLPVDGKVGAQTWAFLVLTVKSGSRGPAVTAVQHSLRFAYGATSLAVDGVYGPRTEAAVRDFQKKFGLPADGIVGMATWNALILHEK
jgi:peptidoglycan hydrolase-like protein with peptidoglycan-binding domain